MTKISASELRKILRRATRCSRRNIILLDKYYHTITYSEINALINDYQKAEYEDEIWDCDNIAMDFMVFSKKEIKKTKKENGALGMLITGDHVQEIYVEELKQKSDKNKIIVRYIDHRDWSIKLPDKKPRWMIL